MFNFNRENQSNFANWFRNIDKTLSIIILILFFLGLFFSFSSTSLIVADKFNTQSYYFFLKHSAFVLLALSLVFFISIPSKDLIKNFFPYIFFLTFILLLLVPFFGSEIKGSKRWVEFLFFPKFIEAVDAIAIMSIAVIPDAITILYSSKMLGKEKSKFVLIAKLVALATIIIGFILLGPILGIVGLAITFVIAVTLQASILAVVDKIENGEQNVK